MKDSTRADLGRYLGRAELLPRGRGRRVDLLVVGTAGLTGGLALAVPVPDNAAEDTASLTKVERLREVRVMVSLEEESS